VLTAEVLRSYLLEMPKGHIFDLSYAQFAEIYPPGESDAVARAALRQFAESCGCDLEHNAANGRYELTRR
jgi:hypothetical protein